MIRPLILRGSEVLAHAGASQQRAFMSRYLPIWQRVGGRRKRQRGFEAGALFAKA